MKKNYYGKVLALTLAASMVSVPAFAEENSPQGDIGSSVSEDETLLEENEENTESSLQDRIDALPTVEELKVMTAEELKAVNAEIEEIYAALEESEDAADLNVEKLQAVADFFTGAVEEQKIDGIVVSTEAELRAAIAQAEGTEDAPTKITILNDIALASTLAINTNVVIDGLGNKLTISESNYGTSQYGPSMITVGNGNNSVNVEIKNLTIDVGIMNAENIVSGTEPNKYMRGILVNKNSKTVLGYNTVVTGGRNATGAAVTATGEVVINGAEIKYNYGTNRGIVLASDFAKVSMTSGSVHDNKAKSGAGVAAVGDEATVNITGGTISNNIANDGGGAIAVMYGGVATIDGETVIENNTANYGGAIATACINSERVNKIYIKGGTIRNNISGQDLGSQIYAWNAGGAKPYIEITGGTITCDTEKAALCNGLADVVISGGTIENANGYSLIGSSSDICLADISSNAEIGKIYLANNNYINISGAMKNEKPITVVIHENTNTSSYIIAKGSNGYKITEEDLAAFTNTLDGYTLYLDTAENAIKAGVAHTVTLNANYGDNAETKEVKGAKISLSADTFIREGYVLIGWNTGADGTGTAYTDSFMPTGDITLYAQWEKAVNYAITYDANGGTGTMSEQSIVGGVEATLTENTFTREGYVFTGWNTATDGTGTAYADGAKVRFDAGTTLYAQWAATSGYCGAPEVNEGKDVTWAYDASTGTLTISGKGAMADYSAETEDGQDSDDGFKAPEWRTLPVKKAVIEEGVTTVGNRAFYDMENLNTVEIAASVETLGLRAINWSGVKEIKFAENSKLKTISFAAINHLSELEKITIPANVETIDSWALAHNNLKEVKFEGNKIKRIGYNSFSHNANLSSVILPTGIEELDEAVFGSCAKIGVFVPATVKKFNKNITESGSTIYFETESAYNAYNSNNYSIIMSVTDGGTFSSDTVFESDKLATPVKEGYVFGGWYEKDAEGNFTGTDVTTPVSGKTYYAKWNAATADMTSGYCGADEDGKNVAWSFNTVNGMLTLTGAGAMKDFTLDGNNWDKTVDCPWEKYRDNIKGVSIDEKITHLGSYAFVNYQNLVYDITDLVNKANEGKLTFGKSVFDSCGKVTGHNLYINFNTSRACFSGTGIDGTLSFGPDVEYIGRNEEAKDNVGYTFRNCQKITKLDFSKATGLKAIYGRSFENMKGVTEIVFPENFVYKLNDDAYMDYIFNGNTNMKGSFDNVIFDITCTSGYAAGVFSACTNMTGNVHFTDTTTIIPESMFKATGATSVTISKNITTVNKNAFHACSKLAAIDATAVNQAITYNDDAFTGIADKSGAYFGSKDRADEFKLATNAYDASKTFIAVTNGGTFAENTVFTVGNLATPAKEDSVFVGWFETEDCSGTAVTVPTAGKTYYAKWTQAGELTATAEGFTGDYDGIEHTVTITPSAEDATITYSVDGGKTYSAVKPQFKNAGTYTVHYKVSKEGCLDVTGSTVVQINKIKNPVTITPSTTSLRGGGTVTFTITAPEGVTINNVICSDESIAVAKTEEGKYTVTLPAGMAEYTFTVDADGDLINNSYDDATTTVSVTRKKSGSSSSTSAPTYGVSTGKTENGTISVTPAKAEAGETVTIKATPDSGYQLDKVTVKDKNNSNVKLTKVSDNEYTFTMPKGKVSVDATFVQKDAADDNQNNAGEASKVIKLQIGSRIVTVDNETVIYDVAPVIRNDRTLVPIRVVTETLGGKVDWNGVTKEVTLNIDGKEIKMTVGKTLEKYGVAPVIIDGRTFVPVRFVADELSATVAWDDATKTVTVTK